MEDFQIVNKKATTTDTYDASLVIATKAHGDLSCLDMN